MNNSAAAAWAREVDADGIGWLTFDKPGSSTNVLSRDALLELDSHLKALAASPPRGLVIRSAKTSGFIAGADIKEFVALTSAAQAEAWCAAAQAIFDRHRGTALPHGRHHQRLRARRRIRARAGLPLSRRHQGRQFFDRPARGDARHPSGFRRHRASGAHRRRAHGHGDDAHRQDAARRPGAPRRASSIGWCFPPTPKPRPAN